MTLELLDGRSLLRPVFLVPPTLLSSVAAPAAAQEEAVRSALAPLLETVVAESGVPGIGGVIVTSQRLVALGVAGVRERGSDTMILTDVPLSHRIVHQADDGDLDRSCRREERAPVG